MMNLMTMMMIVYGKWLPTPPRKERPAGVTAALDAEVKSAYSQKEEAVSEDQ